MANLHLHDVRALGIDAITINFSSLLSLLLYLFAGPVLVLATTPFSCPYTLFVFDSSMKPKIPITIYAASSIILCISFY
jgi:hypothetical protein